MAWDVKALGFKAYCPVCGKRLMLCDACQHDPVDDHYLDNCDYNQTKDCCKHNQDNGYITEITSGFPNAPKLISRGHGGCRGIYISKSKRNK